MLCALSLLLATLLAAMPSAAAGDRFFKEDHFTGADYLALRADGTYTLTGREHMGLFALESGRWERANDRLMFIPSDVKKRRYSGTEVAHRQRLFLGFEGDDAPSIAIPVDEMKAKLDSAPRVLPPYVFFEIDRATFQRETQQTYPLRTRPTR
jgi:hypothetical protein